MLLAKDVMNAAASLLNDVGLSNSLIPSVFTYQVQMPYLNIAMGELRELLEQNNVTVSNQTQTNIIVPIGTLVIPLASLPSNLIEIQHLWERTQGQTEDFIDMTRLEFLPPYQVQTTCLVYWTWNNQQLEFIGATSNRELRLDYIADALPAVNDSSDSISLINAKSFLIYRTAALNSEFIGENKTRADSLNQNAMLAIDRFLGINVKGKQAIATRRRPFLFGYRGRGYV